MHRWQATEGGGALWPFPTENHRIERGVASKWPMSSGMLSLPCFARTTALRFPEGYDDGMPPERQAFIRLARSCALIPYVSGKPASAPANPRLSRLNVRRAGSSRSNTTNLVKEGGILTARKLLAELHKMRGHFRNIVQTSKPSAVRRRYDDPGMSWTRKTAEHKAKK